MGMTSAFGGSGVILRRRPSPTAALRNDWRAVGRDIGVAMDRYDDERKTTSQEDEEVVRVGVGARAVPA